MVDESLREAQALGSPIYNAQCLGGEVHDATTKSEEAVTTLDNATKAEGDASANVEHYDNEENKTKAEEAVTNGEIKQEETKAD